MSQSSLGAYKHSHFFLGAEHRENERKVWLVIILTASMMLVEIIGGTIYGSMALVADGWHMSTHAGAMLITAWAYRFARHNASNPRFTFGTGKLGDLAGFASAVILALIALLIGWESFWRLTQPIEIDFNQAIVVAVVGLLVNLVCAWLLKDSHSHHGHDHHHHHHHHEKPELHAMAGDNNLRAAYIHVLADALTSVLAIAALLLGRSYGWLWADPLMGIVGALVIARWSWGLIRTAGSVLLDAVDEGQTVESELREALEPMGCEIVDLHVWQLGPGHFAAIVSLVSPEPMTPESYKQRLVDVHELSHITVEVHRAGERSNQSPLAEKVNQDACDAAPSERSEHAQFETEHGHYGSKREH